MFGETFTRRRGGHRVPADASTNGSATPRRGPSRRRTGTRRPRRAALARRFAEAVARVDRSGRRAPGAVARHSTTAATTPRLSAAITRGDPLVLDLVKAHPVIAQARRGRRQRRPARGARPRTSSRRRDTPAVTAALIDTLSHVRARHGRPRSSIDVHLWVRELTRLDRAATGAPHFVWQDDGVRVDATDDRPVTYLPALYCRHCNRSGWGVVLAPTGWDLDSDDTTIRRRKLRNDDRFRALIHAPPKPPTATGDEPRCRHPREIARGVAAGGRPPHRFTTPTEKDLAEGTALPGPGALLGHRRRPTRSTTPARHAGNPTASASSARRSPPCCRCRCPPCSAPPTWTAARSGPWSSPTASRTPHTGPVRAGPLARADAAHPCSSGTRGRGDRPGLPVPPDDRPGRRDPAARYRLLPPELADATFRRASGGVQQPSRPRSATPVRRRLLLDVELEFGLRSGVGRTLEAPAARSPLVDVAEAMLRACADEALRGRRGATAARRVDDARLVAWVRGVLERMRTRGAIAHEWLTKFRREDGNRWWITGAAAAVRACPGSARAARRPAFRCWAAGHSSTDLEPVSSARGWYPLWTAKVLRSAPGRRPVLSRLLFTRLRGPTSSPTSRRVSGAQTFALARHLSGHPRRRRPRDRLHGNRSDLRHLPQHRARLPRNHRPARQGALPGRPLRGHHAPAPRRGQLLPADVRPTDIRRVVAREHTSLLPAETRLLYESQFKQPDPPPDAPNVLVATPTLEMGIDIGDLSAVMLSSLPRSVASYLQRVGPGRPAHRQRARPGLRHRPRRPAAPLQRPERTINGEVRPPATYLDAEEILRRQFTASVADVLARRPDAPHPRTTPQALRSTGPGSYLARADHRSRDPHRRTGRRLPGRLPAVGPGCRRPAAPLSYTRPNTAAAPANSPSAATKHRRLESAHRDAEPP